MRPNPLRWRQAHRFALTVRHADRHRHHPRALAREEGDDEVEALWIEEQHAAARRAALDQPPRGTLGGLFELRVRQRRDFVLAVAKEGVRAPMRMAFRTVGDDVDQRPGSKHALAILRAARACQKIRTCRRGPGPPTPLKPTSVGNPPATLSPLAA